MNRVAAFLALGLLAATPAAAACRTVPETIAGLQAVYPTGAVVAEIPAVLVPTVLAWLESEGAPHTADRIVQVVGNRGLGFILITGDRACDGTVAVQLVGARASELVALVRRYQDLRGIGREYEA
ncbi:hypothetical protein MKK55_18635 [Methylobacterium sp. J-059]|uniref:hypothetical protein n=1 Tax=Methylobacterium sp. J-059 TaxID=2836643 RepID=UPI001FB983D1|nr:hypothetical protein [Methylobacterium sp. J-059]MCJ2040948.1 hypothetical protein [Methylobacterium sp. J-059]